MPTLYHAIYSSLHWTSAATSQLSNTCTPAPSRTWLICYFPGVRNSASCHILVTVCSHSLFRSVTRLIYQITKQVCTPAPSRTWIIHHFLDARKSTNCHISVMVHLHSLFSLVTRLIHQITRWAYTPASSMTWLLDSWLVAAGVRCKEL